LYLLNDHNTIPGSYRGWYTSYISITRLFFDIADDTREMNANSSKTIFEQMYNLSGSTSNMYPSVGMVTNAMFLVDMTTSQGLRVSGR
jgi:hypothetical protein